MKPMNTISLQTILAAIPSRVIAVLRDHEHSAADLVRHLTFCYAMLPATPRNVQFDGTDQNRLCREFCRDYCGEDGAVNWEKLLALNVGTGVEVERGHAAPDLELEEESVTCCKSCRRPYDLREGDDPTKYCDPCAQIAVERLEGELRESEAGAAALREALELIKAEADRCMQEVQEVGHTEFAYTVGMAVAVNNALSTNAKHELLAEAERLRDDALGWKFAALQARFCKADIDVSTPAKYLTAEADAKCNILSELERLREYELEAEPLRKLDGENAASQADKIAILQRKIEAAEGMVEALVYIHGSIGTRAHEQQIAGKALAAWQEANK